MTFTGIGGSPFLRKPYRKLTGLKDRPLQILDCRAMANLDSFRRKALTIIVQAPGGHVLRRAMVHADDDIAVPRPGMIAVIVAGPRRMIRMRMVPAYHFQPLRLRGFVCFEHVLPSYREAVAR